MKQLGHDGALRVGVDFQATDVFLLDQAGEAHARRQQAARGVVDVGGRGYARLDQVVGLVQYGVLQAVDKKADDGLVQQHRLLAGFAQGLGGAVHRLARRVQPGHHLDHRRGVGRHEVMQTDEILRVFHAVREFDQVEAGGAGGDQCPAIGPGLFHFGDHRLFGGDIL